LPEARDFFCEEYFPYQVSLIVQVFGGSKVINIDHFYLK